MIPLVVIAGPTAVGKSSAAVKLAKLTGGEVISADSVQVYRGMDIGSAKITKEEMQGVPHHLIDIIDPEEGFDVVRFKKLAAEAVKDVYGRSRLPIVCGGTGFYIQALLYDIDFTENDADMRYRHELEERFDSGEGDRVFEELLRVDPESAAIIHPNNRKRVIRALEFYKKTGQKISSHNEHERARLSPYNSAYFVLTDDRAAVYERIERRVDKMLEEGLEKEVALLRDRGLKKDMVSMQALGYKEMLEYLDGECTLEDALYRIKRDSRHVAKRQLTWFRRERDVIWLDRSALGSEDEIVLAMLKELKARNIFMSAGKNVIK